MAVGLSLGATTGRADDHPRAGQEHPFARAKVGDTAVYSIHTRFANLETHSTATQTVLARTDKQITVHIAGTINYNGQEQALPTQQIQIDLSQAYNPLVFSGNVPAGAQVTIAKQQEGQETLTVGAAQYSCRWTEYKITTKTMSSALSANVTVWWCRDVPMGLVQLVFRGTQEGQTIHLTMQLQQVRSQQ
jgi:hypothetical protein